MIASQFFRRQLVWRFAAALLLGLVSAASATARADDTASQLNDLRQQLEQSRHLIEALSAKVDKLEAQTAAAPAPASVAAVVPSQPNELVELQQQVRDIAGSLGHHSVNEGLPIHGFLDVGYAESSKGQPKGANIGNLDFYLTPQLGSRVKALVELNFEVGEETGTVGTDIERMQLGYSFSDNFTLWLGRFHTPYGYWNTAFHHGAQIQTSVLRPQFLEFEDGGGILPAHTVGLWATGRIPVGRDRIEYDLYAGNGARIVGGESAMPGSLPTGGQLDMNLLGDDNHSLEFGGTAAYVFRGALDGLRLGVHGLSMGVDAYDQSNVAQAKTRVRMVGGFGAYQTDDWEALTEFYQFYNHDQFGGSGSHNSWAGYVQIARSLGQWTPYLRGERANFDQHDSYFAALDGGGSYSRGALGLRFDLTPATALKLEMLRTLGTDREHQQSNQVRFQFATRF